MKRTFLIALMLAVFILSMSIGYCSENRWGQTDTLRLLGKVMPGYIQATGTAIGGASITMASGVVAISPSYAFTNKAIGSTVGEAGTLANGTKGQILKIYIISRAGSGTYILTPTTKSGFSTLTFDAAAEEATLLYLNDTLGWIILGSNGVTIGTP